MTTHTHNKVALITGAAQRVGEQIARGLHAHGFRVIVHYRSSAERAEKIVDVLNSTRMNSAVALGADLSDLQAVKELAERSVKQWGQLDVLINNASGYYPTPWGKATETDWHNLMGSNLMGPFFLTQHLLPTLSERNGCVVNLIDIFAERPIHDFPIYGMTKAALAHMTKSLAFDLRGKVRVNGIAPGAILWPEHPMSDTGKNRMLERIPLGHIGDPSDIMRTVLFLVEDAPYINGQIIAVDGGLNLNT